MSENDDRIRDERIFEVIEQAREDLDEAAGASPDTFTRIVRLREIKFEPQN